jgi:hypothetical protein
MCRTIRACLLSTAALLTLLFATWTAPAVIRDGGVDPANLGQGGWLYLLHNATNHLSPNNITAVTNENSMFQYLKAQGLRYVIVKAGTSDQLYYDSTYSASSPVFTSNLVDLAHANGLLIFGSNRSYGSNIVGEAAIADYVFQQGADGFIFDAEAEWEKGSSHPWITNGPAQGWWLCSTVRSNWPTKFIAHNPFDTLYLHSSFPYKEFGYWCDAVMPQVYHHSASRGNAIAAIHWTDVNYRTFQNSLASLPVGNSNGLTVYWTNAIKPLVLMREVYGANFSPAYPPEDVRNFLDYLVADPNCVTAGGYQGSDYFRSELYDINQWAHIKAATVGTFPGVVNNIVMDDARIGKVGAWTAVKTIDATTGNSVSFTGEFGTDTNSFGTNYFKAYQGTGASYMQFTPNILTAGDYLCYQWHPYRADASASVPFVINFNGGTTTVYANQRTNAGNWSLLGRFNFAAGTAGYVRVTDGILEANRVAMVDGLKLVYAGLPPANSFTRVLGDNTFGQTDVPTAATNFVAVAAGDWHCLGLRADGSVLVWGDGSDSQAPTLQDAVAIAAGGSHNLAIRADGTVVAWGGNDSGQATVPPGLTDVIAVAAGTWHSLALRANGTVAAWGDNSFGQRDVPAGLSNVIAVAAGGNHNLALKADGTVVAWGENTGANGLIAGQSKVPLDLANVVAVAAGQYHSLAVKADGSVVAWGDNSSGQCDVPSGISSTVAIAGGGAHSLALRADGIVTAWGADWNGQCDFPGGLTSPVGIAAGAYHTIVLLKNAVPTPRLLLPSVKGGHFNARLQTLNRSQYVLERQDSLDGTNWIGVRTNVGNGALELLADPSALAPRQFYRMRQW